MKRTLFRGISWPVVVLGLSAPLFVNCAQLQKNIPGADSLPGTCSLDASSADNVEAFDFQGQFKLSADVAGKLKNGVVAAVELKGVADKIDADLKVACGGLAKDLGKGGEFKTGEEACKAAVSAMGEFKAKLGANAKVSLTIDPPKCGGTSTSSRAARASAMRP